MKIYKIQREIDGMFSKGGIPYVTFSKAGKTWNAKQHLTSHLTQLYKTIEYYLKRNPLQQGLRDDPYKGCIILEIDVEDVRWLPAKIIKIKRPSDKEGWF